MPTTIQVSEKMQKELAKRKMYDKETYEEVIWDIMEYAPSSPSGWFIVNGTNATESITFSLLTYSVTFTGSGLPSGASWSVTVNGITESSTNSTITLTLPNGNYSYSIILPSGYSSVNGRGNISVSSASLSMIVNAKKITTPSPVGYDQIIIAAVVAAALIAIAVAVMRRGKIKQ